MPEEFNNQKILENNKLTRFILLILLPTFIVLITLGYFYSLGRYITTENAYIKAPIISVQSQVSGRVEKVFVKDNQRVSKGERLFKIDTKKLELNLSEQKQNLINIIKEIENRKSKYNEAKEELKLARIVFLYKKGSAKNLSNYRPLSLLNNFYKLMNAVIKERMAAVIEKRFSNNNQIKINTAQINKSINSLDQKTKKAIDFAYNRILKFHSKQKVKNILYKDSLGNKLEYKNVPSSSQSINLWITLSTRPPAIKVSQPEFAAIFAAFILEIIPPLPSSPAPPAYFSNFLSSIAILLISRASLS